MLFVVTTFLTNGSMRHTQQHSFVDHNVNIDTNNNSCPKQTIPASDAMYILLMESSLTMYQNMVSCDKLEEMAFLLLSNHWTNCQHVISGYWDTTKLCYHHPPDLLQQMRTTSDGFLLQDIKSILGNLGFGIYCLHDTMVAISLPWPIFLDHMLPLTVPQPSLHNQQVISWPSQSSEGQEGSPQSQNISNVAFNKGYPKPMP